jgi:hypothetical protein
MVELGFLHEMRLVKTNNMSNLKKHTGEVIWLDKTICWVIEVTKMF